MSSLILSIAYLACSFVFFREKYLPYMRYILTSVTTDLLAAAAFSNHRSGWIVRGNRSWVLSILELVAAYQLDIPRTVHQLSHRALPLPLHPISYHLLH